MKNNRYHYTFYIATYTLLSITATQKLYGMFSPSDNPALRNIILSNTAPLTEKIKKSFVAQGGMNDSEIITFESFQELLSKAKDAKKIFSLAVVQPENKNDFFEFYQAAGFADYLAYSQKNITPRQNTIENVFIYTASENPKDPIFPFEYQKTISKKNILNEFIKPYSSLDPLKIDPVEALKNEINILKRIPHPEPVLLLIINSKRNDLIDRLNPTESSDFGPHSSEIFGIFNEILHDAQEQFEIDHAEKNIIKMLLHGWGQRNRLPNYNQAYEHCQNLINTNLRFNPSNADDTSSKIEALDFAYFTQAELIRQGKVNQKNLTEASRLYKLVTNNRANDEWYFRSLLGLVKIAQEQNNHHDAQFYLHQFETDSKKVVIAGKRIPQEIIDEAKRLSPID